ncbi:hypothetical protein BJX62DRAFT_174747 [Aspergillus germanicus]
MHAVDAQAHAHASICAAAHGHCPLLSSVSSPPPLILSRGRCGVRNGEPWALIVMTWGLCCGLCSGTALHCRRWVKGVEMGILGVESSCPRAKLKLVYYYGSIDILSRVS